MAGEVFLKVTVGFKTENIPWFYGMGADVGIIVHFVYFSLGVTDGEVGIPSVAEGGIVS